MLNELDGDSPGPLKTDLTRFSRLAVDNPPCVQSEAHTETFMISIYDHQEHFYRPPGHQPSAICVGYLQGKVYPTSRSCTQGVEYPTVRTSAPSQFGGQRFPISLSRSGLADAKSTSDAVYTGPRISSVGIGW